MILDLDLLTNDPAFSGPFHVEFGQADAPGPSLYEVVSDTTPSFRVWVRERHIADAINVALNYVFATQSDAVPPAAPTKIQRAAAIGVELHQKRAAIVALEAGAGDASDGKSVNQHAVSGAAEAQLHDKLSTDAELLTRELAGLEGN